MERMKPCDCRQPRITWEAHCAHNTHARVSRKFPRWMRFKLLALWLSSQRNDRIAKLQCCTFQERMKPGNSRQPRITWGAHCGHNRHARVSRKVPRLMRLKLGALSRSSHRNGGIAQLRYCTFQERMKPCDCRQTRITWEADCGDNGHAQVSRKVLRWMRFKLVALWLSSQRNG
jgi:hypothetical protein